jgi:dipeptidyl aminopeptidase/acylaminoacyl peptidase
MPLTTFGFLASAGTQWSPDGRSLVVVSEESGSWDLYRVGSEGGVPHRLTQQASADIAGSFSRDGRSIYFCSDRSGSSQVWKMPATGGPATQVTHKGGGHVHESWDARSVYYSKGEEIWRVPVEGGEETPVVRVREGGSLAGWDLSAAGIYYATEREVHVAGNEYTVDFLDFRSGRSETLFRKESPLGHWALAVSPDERWILFGELPAAQSELMLVENFR